MSFLQGHDKVSSIESIAIAPNKKYLACVEVIQKVDSESRQVGVAALKQCSQYSEHAISRGLVLKPNTIPFGYTFDLCTFVFWKCF